MLLPKKIWWLVGCFALLLGISLFIYWDFLLYQRLYIYTDSARDMQVNVWPNYAHIADYVRGNGFPTWSFNIGIGTSVIAGSLMRVSSFDPFSQLLIWFDGTNLAYLFAHILVLKIIVSGLLFFVYLRIARFSNFASLLGSMAFAFSGQMLVRGGWFHYSTEMVFLPILLLSIEWLRNKNNPLGVIAAFAWLAAYNPISVYFYGTFSTLYLIFRQFLTEETHKIKNLLWLWLWLILGVGLSGWIVVPILTELFGSSRFGAGSSYITDGSEHLTTYLRLFSNDAAGNGINYFGWGNYLNSPALYIGLLPLLIIPQIFTLSDQKTKKVFGVTFLLVLLYFIWPLMRQAFNGFDEYHYKLTSFMVTFFMLWSFAYGLELIRQFGLHLKTFLVTLIALVLPITLMLIPSVIWEPVVNTAVAPKITYFLTIYSVIILVGIWKKISFVLISQMVGIILVVELAIFGHYTVNSRETVLPESLSNRVSYYDGSELAAKAIRQNDKGFYRINKDYKSVFCCGDALVQNYYGTETYQSFNQPAYLDFLEGVNASTDKSFRTFAGFGERYHLNNLLGVKYLLSKTGPLVPGYQQVGQLGDVRYYQNQLALPVGFAYEQSISKTEFSALNQEQQDLALYQAAVVDKPLVCQTNTFKTAGPDTLRDSTALSDYIGQIYRERALIITNHGQKTIQGNLSLDRPGLLFFSVPFSTGWKLKIDGRSVDTLKVNFGLIGACIDRGSHLVNLTYSPPNLNSGILISIISFGAIALIRRRQTQIESLVSSER